jgi:hypothetical protein
LAGTWKEIAMTERKTVEADAKGQFAQSQAVPPEDGVASAIPTEVVGNQDATMFDHEKKQAPKPGFDIRTQTNKRG